MTISSLDALFAELWRDYRELNPQADAIHSLLADGGETIHNDHIAFRTYDLPTVGLDAVAAPFLDGGYTHGGDYTFPDKHLRAKHFEPPNATWPKVFVSELMVGELPPEARSIIKDLVAAVPEELPGTLDFPVAGRPWVLHRAAHATLLAVSEYAAWLAAFGFRANHFTVDVRALGRFRSLAEFNGYLEAQGFELNAAGGEVKGSPAVYLEQSSTLAAPVDLPCDDGILRLPACYYEFAWRHDMPDGRPFPGFIAQSANRIFESTDTR
jgi:hypothetical protein